MTKNSVNVCLTCGCKDFPNGFFLCPNMNPLSQVKGWDFGYCSDKLIKPPIGWGDKHDGGRNRISCGLSYKDYMGITVNDIHAERLRAEKICANDQ